LTFKATNYRIGLIDYYRPSSPEPWLEDNLLTMTWTTTTSDSHCQSSCYFKSIL